MGPSKTVELPSITIRATRSRINTGLLAIPSVALGMFPNIRSNITVRFDHNSIPTNRAFIPADTSAKEARIYGLSEWFRDARIRPGDLIRIAVVQVDPHIYWIIREDEYRSHMIDSIFAMAEDASSEVDAQDILVRLPRYSGRKTKDVVKREILSIGDRFEEERRRAKHTVDTRLSARPWVRALLGELYEGHCQICNFTFLKANGRPYYEVHHILPEIGDDPHNLLVVCSNCHSKLTHGTVGELEFRDSWLVGLTLCGKHTRVNQLLSEFNNGHVPASALLILAPMLMTRKLHIGP